LHRTHRREIVDGVTDNARVPEPGDGGERSILLGWLAFHRNALEAKCDGLDAAQLVERSASPSPLSLSPLSLLGWSAT
jgi:hypothetical protein